MARVWWIGPLVLSAAACSPPGEPAPVVAETAAVTTPVESATPSSRPGPRTEVDWDSGKGTPSHPNVDPSPVGWYPAAFPADDSRTVYLTFDDGPSEYTPQMLRLLRKHDANATFFIVGTQVAGRESLIRDALRDGNAIGNHTWDHPDLTTLRSAQIKDQLERVAEVAPVGPCMRPPYGAVHEVSGRVSVAMGFQPVMWTGQAFDWRPTATASQIVKDIKAATRPGAVILLHDGGGDRSRTVQAVSRLLPFWKQQGYAVESIAACRVSGG